MNIVKVIKWCVCTILFLLFVYLVWTSFQWEDFLRIGLRFLHEPMVLALIFFGYFTSFLLKAIAWRYYFNGKISLSSSLYGIFYSLLINHLLPIKIGDIARAMIVTKRERWVTLEQSLHSVFILRLMDIATLSIIVGLGAIYYQSFFVIQWNILLILLLFCSLLLFIVKGRFPNFFKRNTQLFIQAFARLNGVKIFVFVFLSWILEASVLLGVAKVVMEPLSTFEAIWANSITIIGQIFQFTPGGITTYETVMTYALSFLGMPANQALIIAIYNHAFKFFFAYIVGLYIYIRYPVTINTFKGWIKVKGVKHKQHEKRI